MLFNIEIFDLVSSILEGCQKNPCRNGGTCKDLGDEKYECQCTKDYRGYHCEISMCSFVM